MGERDELFGVEGFGDVADVNEAGGFVFGGADVHSPVDLHGVGRDDFGAEVARDGAFADSGGADEENR